MKKSVLGIIASALVVSSCSQHAPMQTVDHVDLDRFMGDWYVVANIPTFLEKGAHNAVETYRMNNDGTIATTFRFRDGGFDGEIKEYHPTGFIQDTDTNALWGMRFVWPIKADYRIVYLDEDYSKTVIARAARDYVWVMSRDPQLSDAEFDKIKEFISGIGYDTSELQRVPQQWPEMKPNTRKDKES
jgi:apolipoprotein D and lipocalin family protein